MARLLRKLRQRGPLAACRSEPTLENPNPPAPDEAKAQGTGAAVSTVALPCYPPPMAKLSLPSGSFPPATSTGISSEFPALRTLLPNCPPVVSKSSEASHLPSTMNLHSYSPGARASTRPKPPPCGRGSSASWRDQPSQEPATRTSWAPGFRQGSITHPRRVRPAFFCRAALNCWRRSSEPTSSGLSSKASAAGPPQSAMAGWQPPPPCA
mmetsp:Transcript_55427/g.125109  ORF Transcript_55427/g.125109 Transcript_55427/m.125109 type:complete len:210 (-) Transcript_55427:14-643(-)